MMNSPEQAPSRGDLIERVDSLLTGLGQRLEMEGVACEAEYHQGHDRHAFFTLTHSPGHVLHIQVYPGMSDAREAKVFARIMSKAEMLRIRDGEGVSPGNEHEAVTHSLETFTDVDKRVPWDEIKLARDLTLEVRAALGR